MRLHAGMIMQAAVLLAHPVVAQENATAAAAPRSVQINVTFYSGSSGARLEPLTISRGSALFKVMIGGREVWGLIDNRSERSIIDMTLAQSLGLEAQPAEGSFLSPVGQVAKRRVSDIPITIPHQLEITAATLAAVDLAPLVALHQREIGFVLGRDYLTFMALQVDGGRRVFRLMPSGGGQSSTGLQPVAIASDTHLVEMEVLGRQEVVALDLALGVPLQMTPALWAQLQPDALPTTRRGPLRRSTGTVTIGTLNGRNPPVLVEERGDSSAEIAIGLPMFATSNILIDFGAGQLWIMPSARPDAPDGAAP